MWCGKPTNEFLANGIRINFSLVHEDIQMMGDEIYNEDKVICHLCIETIGEKVPPPLSLLLIVKTLLLTRGRVHRPRRGFAKATC